MKKYDIALFDLDGTLSESGEGILYCVRKIFEETGRPLPDEKEIFFMKSIIFARS